jgi:hypothetical protein
MVASALAATLILGGAFGPPAWSVPKSVLPMLDPEKDGKVDLAEARTASSTAFERLETDDDGALDHRELRGRLNAKPCGGSRQGWHAQQDRISRPRRAMFQGGRSRQRRHGRHQRVEVAVRSGAGSIAEIEATGQRSFRSCSDRWRASARSSIGCRDDT